MYILGFDIGGTKCAVTTAQWDGETITLLEKSACPTDLTVAPEAMIDRLITMADGILTEKPQRIGISCGGPLSSEKGLILGPPNLPGWDHVEIVSQLQAHYGVPVTLQNDANACAVAEWKFGAGKGTKNMIFMTFGTGLGAGLILDGRLYCGTNDNAGEVGHIRLDRFGPVGYGKAGSFEGFCSGGGLSQLGYTLALEKVQTGTYPLYFQKGMTQKDVTAKSTADADHIVGELMKGFLKKRPLSEQQRQAMKANCPGVEDAMLDKLQRGLPALSLCSLTALNTAFCNDVDPELIYAQGILGMGKPGDIVICMSTSGNAKNVFAAARTAKALGLTVIGLTGMGGGKLSEIADICIRVPEKETFKIQELHLPVYHYLCAATETHFFSE